MLEQTGIIINLADATNGEVQAMAAHYIAFHRHLILRPDMVALLEHSATMANFRALELARDNTKKSKVLCSNMSHNSISKACHSLGLEPIVLDANPENNFQVDQENLIKHWIITKENLLPLFQLTEPHN